MRFVTASVLIFMGITTMFFPASLPAQPQAAQTSIVTNKDVIEMVKAGLTTEIVETKIKLSACDFDTSADALKELKASGVPDSLILVMLQTFKARPTQPTSLAQATQPAPSTATVPTTPTVSRYEQENTGYPAAEIFGGYSYLNHGAGDPTNSRLNLNGIGVSVTGNANDWFGVEGEFGAHYGNCFGSILPCHNTSFMGGPKISFRDPKVTGFFHALVGVDHGEEGLSSVGLPGVSVSDNKFALGFGGGVDIRATNTISVRAGQLDFITVHHGDNLVATRQNNIRISAGITFTLARRSE